MTDGKCYRTIVVDPPWRYSTVRIPTGAVRPETQPAAVAHYPDMSIAEISALPVADWSDSSAHLYLWVTNPILPDTLPILSAWGFRYVTLLTWHKLGGIGLGYYFRGDTEHVIFGVRGRLPIPANIRERNWFAAPKRGHSVKPDRFYEIVERVSPEPRLEVFARRRRYGWDVWGNEAPEEQRSQSEMGLPS